MKINPLGNGHSHLSSDKSISLEQNHRDRSEGFPSLRLQPGGERKRAQLVGLHGKPQEERNGGSWLSSWTIQDYAMEERPGPFISYLNASTPPHVPLLHALLCRIHSSSLGFFLCLSSCMSSLTWFAPFGIPESFRKLVK